MDPGVLFRLGHEYPEPYCSSDRKYVSRRCFLELLLVTGGNCCIYYFAGIEMAPNGLSNIGAAPGAFLLPCLSNRNQLQTTQRCFADCRLNSSRGPIIVLARSIRLLPALLRETPVSGPPILRGFCATSHPAACPVDDTPADIDFLIPDQFLRRL